MQCSWMELRCSIEPVILTKKELLKGTKVPLFLRSQGYYDRMYPMKKCNKCFEEKMVSEFYRDKATKDGRATICKACKNINTQVWREQNREKYNADARSYNKQNYQKLRIQRYKMTVDQYEKMLKDQNNSCALCGRGPSQKRPLAIDHCHETGRVRGLLCYSCNRHLAGIDNKAFLERALRYIKQTL
jgi:hypothetical protein